MSLFTETIPGNTALAREIQAVFDETPNATWPEGKFDKKFKIHCYLEDIRSSDSPKPMNEWADLEISSIESLIWKFQKLKAAYDDKPSPNLLSNHVEKTIDTPKIIPVAPVMVSSNTQLFRTPPNPDPKPKKVHDSVEIKRTEPAIEIPVNAKSSTGQEEDKGATAAPPKRVPGKLPKTTLNINLGGLLPSVEKAPQNPKQVRAASSERQPTVQATLPPVPQSPSAVPPKLPPKKPKKNQK
jgi:hypothetical protein